MLTMVKNGLLFILCGIALQLCAESGHDKKEFREEIKDIIEVAKTVHKLDSLNKLRLMLISAVMIQVTSLNKELIELNGLDEQSFNARYNRVHAAQLIGMFGVEATPGRTQHKKNNDDLAEMIWGLLSGLHNEEKRCLARNSQEEQTACALELNAFVQDQFREIFTFLQSNR